MAQLGQAYLEELRVVGAVRAGFGLRALGAPLQLPEAGGRVEVTGIQLGEVELRKVSAELLVSGSHTLRRQRGRRLVSAERGYTQTGTHSYLRCRQPGPSVALGQALVSPSDQEM